jgi:hypothetical protein
MTAPKEFEAAYSAQEHLEAGLVLKELSLHETRSVSFLLVAPKMTSFLPPSEVGPAVVYFPWVTSIPVEESAHGPGDSEFGPEVTAPVTTRANPSGSKLRNPGSTPLSTRNWCFQRISVALKSPVSRARSSILSPFEILSQMRSRNAHA